MDLVKGCDLMFFKDVLYFINFIFNFLLSCDLMFFKDVLYLTDFIFC